ncbi:hypothetical protein B0H17DRAFT_1190844 [Mycena rosella]|uniref:Uncharacterized protein n=1 Tax=Mycena rosella TaxID=1033263 RepID=A0AAD7H0R8_MYCRO|nr:hypothetical protein B0H17DRAFT_1190844 [Mycena rosella]
MSPHLKRTISDLQTDIQRAKNNLDARSSIEIVTGVLRMTIHPPLRLAPGVQPVLDAIAKGHFDGPGVATVGGALVHYADAQAAVVAAVAARGGLPTKSVAQALGKLYGELFKHHHGGVTSQISIKHDQQTMSEAVAAMIPHPRPAPATDTHPFAYRTPVPFVPAHLLALRYPALPQPSPRLLPRPAAKPDAAAARRRRAATPPAAQAEQLQPRASTPTKQPAWALYPVGKRSCAVVIKAPPGASRAAGDKENRAVV